MPFPELFLSIHTSRAKTNNFRLPVSSSLFTTSASLEIPDCSSLQIPNRSSSSVRRYVDPAAAIINLFRIAIHLLSSIDVVDAIERFLFPHAVSSPAALRRRCSRRQSSSGGRPRLYGSRRPRLPGPAIPAVDKQAQQLFQRDAQTITPEALESVKAALLASSETEQKVEKKKKAIPRKAAGQTWVDPTLAEWPESKITIQKSESAILVKCVCFVQCVANAKCWLFLVSIHR
ncbi:hypothetical protein LINPERPRIM_LOCUS14111 [Linum perenne]